MVTGAGSWNNASCPSGYRVCTVPEAMMRALMRISKRAEMQDMPKDIMQMCIENTSNFMGLFASHPPIEKRIETLSRLTQTPVPELPVTLRRPPRRPWDRNRK